MTKPPVPPKSQRDTRGEPDPELVTPRWVKVFGVVAFILILLFIILHLTGNSPSGHMP